MKYGEYLKSQHWKDVSHTRRYDIDGNKCVCCGCEENLNVHHKFYRNSWYDTQIDDLVTLCHQCHLAVHRTQEKLDSICRDVKRLKELNDFTVWTWASRVMKARLAHKIVVLCWEKNRFSESEVTELCRKIMDIVWAKGYEGVRKFGIVQEVEEELAIVKYCYAANQSPDFDKCVQRYRQKRNTKYKK